MAVHSGKDAKVKIATPGNTSLEMEVPRNISNAGTDEVASLGKTSLNLAIPRESLELPGNEFGFEIGDIDIGSPHLKKFKYL